MFNKFKPFALANSRGNFGHAGRPGKRGGSLPKLVASVHAASKTADAASASVFSSHDTYHSHRKAAQLHTKASEAADALAERYKNDVETGSLAGRQAADKVDYWKGVADSHAAKADNHEFLAKERAKGNKDTAYRVIDSEHNQRYYPTHVGKIFPEPLGSAQVEPVPKSLMEEHQKAAQIAKQKNEGKKKKAKGKYPSAPKDWIQQMKANIAASVGKSSTVAGLENRMKTSEKVNRISISKEDANRIRNRLNLPADMKLTMEHIETFNEQIRNSGNDMGKDTTGDAVPEESIENCECTKMANCGCKACKEKRMKNDQMVDGQEKHTTEGDSQFSMENRSVHPLIKLHRGEHKGMAKMRGQPMHKVAFKAKPSAQKFAAKCAAMGRQVVGSMKNGEEHHVYVSNDAQDGEGVQMPPPMVNSDYFGHPVMLNRDNAKDFKLPEDGWYHIIPKGEFEHKPTGLIQVLDEPAFENIVNRFNEDKQQPNFPGILVDFDHFSQDTKMPSEAAGWIEDLQNRDDGVWAKIRWSDKGEESVSGGRYRLVSPVWNRNDCETLDNGRVRPQRLDTVALTNDPNLKGLKPLSNRTAESEAGADGKLKNGSGSSSEDKEVPMPTQYSNPVNYKQELLSLLGLPNTATDNEVLMAIARKKEGVNHEQEPPMSNKKNDAEVEVLDESSEDVEQLNNRLTELQGEYTKLLNAQVERDLEQFAPVIKNKDAVKKMLLTNRDDTIAMLTALQTPTDGKQEDKEQKDDKSKAPLHNRNKAEIPNVDGVSKGDEARAAKIANRAVEIQKTQRIPYSVAWSKAQREFKE